jgi:hypothetical protein
MSDENVLNAAPIPFPKLDGGFAAERVKWRGIAFECGERVLIIPPLPLDLAEAASEEVAQEAPPEEAAGRGAWASRRFESMRRQVVLALRRNYSEAELPEAEIVEFLTLDNLHAAHQAALGMADKAWPRVRSGAELKPGERPL